MISNKPAQVGQKTRPHPGGRHCYSLCPSASEDSGLGEQRAGLQQQTLGVDPDGVEHGEEVLRAEQRVRQSESQRGRDETSAVLHHPRPGAPLDRRGLADGVDDGVAWTRRMKVHLETEPRLS